MLERNKIDTLEAVANLWLIIGLLFVAL